MTDLDLMSNEQIVLFFLIGGALWAYLLFAYVWGRARARRLRRSTYRPAYPVDRNVSVKILHGLKR